MNMTYHPFIKSIDAQVEKTRGCAGYAAFSQDMEQLKRLNMGFGLPSITANVWLQKICELPDEELLAYAQRYQKGWLDAETAHFAFVGRNPKKNEEKHHE